MKNEEENCNIPDSMQVNEISNSFYLIILASMKYDNRDKNFNTIMSIVSSILLKFLSGFKKKSDRDKYFNIMTEEVKKALQSIEEEEKNEKICH